MHANSTIPTDVRRNSEIPGLVSPEPVERTFIRQTVKQALERNPITRQQIRKARMSEPARRFIEGKPRRAAYRRNPKYVRRLSYGRCCNAQPTYRSATGSSL